MKMNSAPKRLIFSGLAVLVLGAGAFTAYDLISPPPSLLGAWNMTDQGVAISGYDTVAYFTEGKPQKGSTEFQHDWQDATWQFANQSHRDLFAADPEAYVPEFGGFCAAAMSYGTVAKADPETWAIIEGKLYLNYDELARELFHENLLANIFKAETKWVAEIDEYEQDKIRLAKVETKKRALAEAKQDR